MIGIYDYTVILTYANLIFGVMGIFVSFTGNLSYSFLLLILAGICDMFDGVVAKTKKNRTGKEKNYGIQIDSLADLVSFCVLPTIIGFVLGCHMIFAYCFFILAVLIRLSHFNVTELERCSTTTDSRKYYEGLPVTSTAIIFPMLSVAFYLLHLEIASILPAVFLVTGFMFLLKIKIPKIDVTKNFPHHIKRRRRLIEQTSVKND